MAERVPELPKLPKHYNPLAKLPEADRERLLDTVIERYICGQKISDLALALGVDATALYYWLVKHREDQWKDAKIAHALSMLESAQEELDNAHDGLSVSRARERLKSAQWTLEKLFRRLFGSDPQFQINISEYSSKPTEDLVATLEKMIGRGSVRPPVDVTDV